MKIKNAIISVSDKQGIVAFARELSQVGVKIFSTGRTYLKLKENQIEAAPVEQLTGVGEMFNGRVRTLHPNIHGGILHRRDDLSHTKTLKQFDIQPIDLVVVNLYPFKETTASDQTNLNQAIEEIDIGGVTLLRAAAKNYAWVTVICDHQDLAPILEEIKEQGQTTLTTRKRLAVKAFETTMLYDTNITSYLRKELLHEEQILCHLKKKKDLRYGENPHQKAILYEDLGAKDDLPNLPQSLLLNGKEMSYNNYLDAESALRVCFDFPDNAAVIVKHQNPCGIATGNTIDQALKMAWEGDIVSSFGSIIAVNNRFSLEAARFLEGKFVEIIIAPDFEAAALTLLKKKKKLRIIQINPPQAKGKKERSSLRYLRGGMLKQDDDQIIFESLNSVTPHSTTPNSSGSSTNPLDRRHYLFSFSAVKHLKSNAIAITHEYQPGLYMLVGMGAGQTNRLDAIERLAIPKMEQNLTRLYPDTDHEKIKSKLILASDAFLPFADNVETAYQSGIRKIIQPGGSIRDQEVIDKTNQYQMEMVLTHIRHFLH